MTGQRIRELDFQHLVIDMAKALQWRHYHETESIKSERGKPDLELSHERFGIVFLELKVGKNKPSPDQVEWIDWYRRCGFPAYVVWPRHIDEIERLLRGQQVMIEETWR